MPDPNRAHDQAARTSRQSFPNTTQHETQDHFERLLWDGTNPVHNEDDGQKYRCYSDTTGDSFRSGTYMHAQVTSVEGLKIYLRLRLPLSLILFGRVHLSLMSSARLVANLV